MKTLLRSLIIYMGILYILRTIIPGVTIEGGIMVYGIGALCSTILFLVLKPVLNFVSFPANMISMGLVSLLINALLIYLLTILIPAISVNPFIYSKVDLGFVIIPELSFNTFFAYVFTGFVTALLDGIIKWLIK